MADSFDLACGLGQDKGGFPHLAAVAIGWRSGRNYDPVVFAVPYHQRRLLPITSLSATRISGFTLLELRVVMAIIGMLISCCWPKAISPTIERFLLNT